MDPETWIEQAVVQQLLQQEIAGENSSQSVQQLCAAVLLAVLCYHTLFDNGDKVTGETHIESVQHSVQHHDVDSCVFSSNIFSNVDNFSTVVAHY